MSLACNFSPCLILADQQLIVTWSNKKIERRKTSRYRLWKRATQASNCTVLLPPCQDCVLFFQNRSNVTEQTNDRYFRIKLLSGRQSDTTAFCIAWTALIHYLQYLIWSAFSCSIFEWDFSGHIIYASTCQKNTEMKNATCIVSWFLQSRLRSQEGKNAWEDKT